eukprot:116484-Chlamydomonas_euryale.AAC.1
MSASASGPSCCLLRRLETASTTEGSCRWGGAQACHQRRLTEAATLTEAAAQARHQRRLTEAATLTEAAASPCVRQQRVLLKLLPRPSTGGRCRRV